MSVPRCSLTLLGPSCQCHTPGFPNFKVLRPWWAAHAQQRLLWLGAAFRNGTGQWARTEGTKLWTPQQVWGTEAGKISGQSGGPSSEPCCQERYWERPRPSKGHQAFCTFSHSQGGEAWQAPAFLFPHPRGLTLFSEGGSLHPLVLIPTLGRGVWWWSLVLTHSRGSHGCVAGDGSPA